jgi:hypothetical protein
MLKDRVEALRTALRGDVIEPGDPGYEAAGKRNRGHADNPDGYNPRYGHEADC